MCGVIHPYVWCNSSICVVWFINIRVHTWGTCGSSMCMLWLVRACDVTDSCVCCDSFTCIPWRIYMYAVTQSCGHQMYWLIRACVVTHSCVCRGSFTRMLWRIRVYAVTLSCVWCDSFSSLWLQIGVTAHSNTPQHTATHRLYCERTKGDFKLAWQHTATHCDTLQHTEDAATEIMATSNWRASAHSNTATHCNTLQHTATHRGYCYRNKGDFKLACEDYTRAIELNPWNATAFNNRGSYCYCIYMLLCLINRDSHVCMYAHIQTYICIHLHTYICVYV